MYNVKDLMPQVIVKYFVLSFGLLKLVHMVPQDTCNLFDAFIWIEQT